MSGDGEPNSTAGVLAPEELGASLERVAATSIWTFGKDAFSVGWR